MTAPPNLTIRNLTSTPINLKVVERYEAHHHKVEVPKGIASNFTSFARNATSFVNTKTPVSLPSGAPSAPKLAENAQSFAHQEVDVRVEPFTVANTDLAAREGEQRVMRITIEVEGQRYRIDTPSPKDASQTFVPLVPDPKFNLTGVFIEKDSYLAVYSSANLQCWMREMKDETPLSGLSIPGTHNSPTCHKALPSVRCQAVSPLEQLQNGVRFFDIRVQPQSPNDPSKDGLILVHGVFPISLTGNKYFRDLVGEVLKFLDENPSETVIMSVKREGPGQHTDQQLSMILHDHYATERWYTDPAIPRLGEVRKKIVLMRRFMLDDRIKSDHDGRGWAIDAENWAYNTPNDTHGAVCVQDFCEVLDTENIDKKITYSCEHLGRAGACICPLPGITTDAVNPVPPGPLYLNFLSASNFWKVGCWPEKIARQLNPAIIDFLCEKHHADSNSPGDGTTGVVVCDWVGDNGDWDLVRCIVGMNARLEWREKQGM